MKAEMLERRLTREALKKQLSPTGSSPQKKVRHPFRDPKVLERMRETSLMLGEEKKERARRRAAGLNPYLNINTTNKEVIKDLAEQEQEVKSRLNIKKESHERRLIEILAMNTTDGKPGSDDYSLSDEAKAVLDNYPNKTQIAERVIEVIKKFPREAMLMDDSTISSFWDEYKEQIQFEESTNWELYDETIRSAIYDELMDLDSDKIQGLLINEFQYLVNCGFEERLNKLNDLEEQIIDEINDIANEEQIDYVNDLEYVRWIDIENEENEIIAKILRKTGPGTYVGQVYGELNTQDGDEAELDILYLDSYCGLERISKETFELRLRNLRMKE